MSEEGDRGHDVPGRLSVELELEDGAATLRLTGELELRTGPELRARSLTVLAGRPTRLVVDLAAAGFLDSSGLAALLDVADAARQAGVPLQVGCGENGAARRTIEATGTQHMLGMT